MRTTDFHVREIEARTETERAPAERSNREREITAFIDDTLEDSFPASDPPSHTPTTGAAVPPGIH